MSDLVGRVAVVTGGASGIGAALVHELSARGATVWIADLAESSQGLSVDVSDDHSVRTFAAAIGHETARVDFLFNVAGVVAVGDIATVTEEAWDRTFAVNVKGVWLMTRALLPLMGEGSAIVNVSSAAGLRPVPEVPAYVASKSAVVGLTRAMALELGARGIRVNCVCPGLVDTPLARATQQDRSAGARADVSDFAAYVIKRDARPEEVSAVVLSVALATYMTGSTIAVDGGRSLH